VDAWIGGTEMERSQILVVLKDDPDPEAVVILRGLLEIAGSRLGDVEAALEARGRLGPGGP
jgi:hypothetical protein